MTNIVWNSHQFINDTPLTLAIRENNAQIVELLLSNENIDVNEKFILKTQYFYKILTYYYVLTEFYYNFF